MDIDRDTRVSVVIPTYNRASVVGAAIESALGQTHSALEVIVVDDASTDDTPEVVRRIADPRLRYLRLAANEKSAAARNAGIDAARGGFVAFLDSDDTWLPSKLERQLDAVRAAAPASDAWVSYTQLLWDTGYEQTVGPRRGKREGEPVGDYLFIHEGEMSTCTLLLPTRLAAAVRFGSFVHDDWEFTLRLGAEGASFIFVPEPLTRVDHALRADRLHLQFDAATSLAWLDRHRALLTPHAARAFRANKVTRALRREGKRGRALVNVVAALATGSIPLRDALRLTVVALIDDRVHASLWRIRGSARRGLKRLRGLSPRRG